MADLNPNHGFLQVLGESGSHACSDAVSMLSVDMQKNEQFLQLGFRSEIVAGRAQQVLYLAKNECFDHLRRINVFAGGHMKILHKLLRKTT